MMIGNDFSHWQGIVNWVKTKAAGAKFAYIKASDGRYVDAKFAVNSASCDLDYKGPYHFLQYSSNTYTLGQEVAWGTAQAQNFIRTIGAWKHNLIGMLDIENYGESIYTCLSRVSKIAMAFRTEYRRVTGHNLLIYMNTDLEKQKEWTALGYKYIWRNFVDSPLMIANYNTVLTPPSCWKTWHIWQYSKRGNGALFGVESAAIDMDRDNGNLNELVIGQTAPTDHEMIMKLWAAHPEIH